MNSNPSNFRPLSPTNTPHHVSHTHQCPHCKCSPPNNYQQIYPNSRPIVHINYHSPPKDTRKQSNSPVYNPVIPVVRKNDHIHKYPVPVYNKNNIYYNRPPNLNTSNNSSRNNSFQKLILNKPQIRSPSPHQILIRPPVYNRPISPIFRPQTINKRSDVRFVSPPASVYPIESKKSENIYFQTEKEELLASNSSAFTFGQPRKPEILTKKKPGIKRLNSLNNQSSQDDQIQIKINQITKKKLVLQPLNFSYNHNLTSSQKHHSHFIIQKPIQLKEKLSEKYQQLLQIKPKRYYSSSEGQTTTSNNTQLFSHNENDYNVIDQVNGTPLRNAGEQNNEDQFNINKEGMEIRKKNSHLIEEEQKIAEILVQELKLNYDYFNKNQITDRSISDHVQL